MDNSKKQTVIKQTLLENPQFKPPIFRWCSHLNHVKPPFLGDFPLPCLMTWEGKLILTCCYPPGVAPDENPLGSFWMPSEAQFAEENPNHPKSMKLPLGMVLIFIAAWIFWQKFWQKFVDGGQCFWRDICWDVLTMMGKSCWLPSGGLEHEWSIFPILYVSHILGTCLFYPIWRSLNIIFQRGRRKTTNQNS